MTREIIKKYKIIAKKSIGQNFLINTKIIKNIANIINIKGENIIEVGPGYGALTEELLKQNPKSLELVELDQDMIEILKDRIEKGNLILGKTNFNINKINVLKFTPNFKNYNLIANIPYYITSPILRHFLYKLKNKPKKMVILLQKDVGEKIINNKKNSVLSLIIQKKAFVKEKLFVSKTNFIPSPKVESSVLCFEIHNKYNQIPDKKFLEIIKIGFSATRKKLIKNLQSGGFNKKIILDTLNSLGYTENTRAEELSINDWCILIQKL